MKTNNPYPYPYSLLTAIENAEYVAHYHECNKALGYHAIKWNDVFNELIKEETND